MLIDGATSCPSWPSCSSSSPCDPPSGRSTPPGIDRHSPSHSGQRPVDLVGQLFVDRRVNIALTSGKGKLPSRRGRSLAYQTIRPCTGVVARDSRSTPAVGRDTSHTQSTGRPGDCHGRGRPGGGRQLARHRCGVRAEQTRSPTTIPSSTPTRLICRSPTSAPTDQARNHLPGHASRCGPPGLSEQPMRPSGADPSAKPEHPQYRSMTRESEVRTGRAGWAAAFLSLSLCRAVRGRAVPGR